MGHYVPISFDLDLDILISLRKLFATPNVWEWRPLGGDDAELQRATF